MFSQYRKKKNKLTSIRKLESNLFKENMRPSSPGIKTNIILISFCKQIIKNRCISFDEYVTHTCI